MNNKLKQKINAYKVVSFDVFDTLIVRDVNHYLAVFNLVENIASKRYGNNVDGFAQKRIEAERRAREKHHQEVTIDEIYECFDIEDKEQIQCIEIETEIALAQRNEDIYEIYKYCVSINKTIVVISDMYLHKDTINKILYKNGYTQIKEVFVSCDCGCKKRDGKLFEYVTRFLKIPKSSLLHFGDSFRSDFLFARLSGVNAIWKKPRNRLDYMSPEYYLYSFTNKRINKIKDKYEKIGYEVYGPLIYEFLQWVNEESKLQNCNKVFFASRDGFILEKAYRTLYPESEGKYLRVSRRSVQVPAIGYKGDLFETFTKLASFDPITTNKSIYKRIGLDDKDIDTQETYEVKQSDIIDFLKDDKYVQNNVERILDNSSREREALHLYLAEMGFEGKVAFVDVGWKCSTQKVLSQLSDADIVGLYFGVHSSVDNIIKAEGFLFNRSKDDNFYSIMGGMSLLEAILTSGELSLKKYTIVDGKVAFEFGKQVTLAPESHVFSVQRGIKKYINDISKSIIRNIKPDEYLSYNCLKRIICNPNKGYLKTFGVLEMENDESIRPILSNIDYRALMRNFGESGWKIGYLKKMLKIPLPFFGMFKVLYTLYKR